MVDAEVKKSNQQQCPNCGADMVFSPQVGHLYCSHCGSVEEIERSYDVRERDFVEMESVPTWQQSSVAAYRCNNCGAQTIMSATTIATTCPFCNSAVVVDSSALNSVKPDTVLPFETTVDEAQQAILHWRKKRLFAPNKFRKSLQIQSVKGTYIPVWTFDCDTSTSYSGTLGKRCTRTVRRNGKTYTETYIRWFPVSGTIRQIFDDLFVNGSNSVPQSQVDKLHPFPQSKYVVYDDKYLAGYVADNYTVQPQQAFKTAQATMRSVIERAIMAQHFADVKGTLNLSTTYLSRSFKYLMLPLYVTATKYKNKVFNSYVSGVESAKGKSKVSGKAPVSWWKVLLTVIACGAAALGLAYLFTSY